MHASREPRAFVAHLPAPPSPLVVSVPHAGLALDAYAEALVPELDPRCDADLHVDRLVAPHLRAAEVPHLVARLSRFVCDLNRAPDDVRASAVPEHPAPRGTGPRGFVWEETTRGAPVLRRPLSLAEWRARAALHADYHATLAGALAAARERFGFAVLLDVHSMPSRGRAGHGDPGALRAECVPGDRDGTSCAPELSASVARWLAARGHSVAPNTPYRGGFITAHHGRPAEGRHALQLELRRDLYMDEDDYRAREPGFSELARLLRDLLAALATWRPGVMF